MCVATLQVFLAYNKGRGPLANSNSVRLHLWANGWLADTKQVGVAEPV
jgi:hypothetical protein